MMVSNFSTEPYNGIQYESCDDKQLQYWNLIMVSNLNTVSFDGK